MGHFIDDKTLVNSNAAAFAKRVESQYSIFLEKTPTFCNYFHINVNQSTLDTGLENVEHITGKNAATKYNLIKDLPIYGIEQIVLDLNDDEEHGFDGVYDAEGIMLPNTIIPSPDDYFMITSVGKHFFFRVTEVAYDTIKSKNFYRINFSIKAADDETYYEQFMADVKEKYRCVFRNFGTEDKFIITEDAFMAIEAVEKVYSKVAERYLDLFYNEKYNALLVHDPNSSKMLYDVYVHLFCNRNAIFDRKREELFNIRLYIEKRDYVEKRYKYQSLDGAMENLDVKWLENLSDAPRYYATIPTFSDSIFKYHGDYTVYGIEALCTDKSIYGTQLTKIISDELYNAMVLKDTEIEGNIYTKVIRAMLHGEIQYIGNLVSKYDGRYNFPNTYEYLHIIPFFLYGLIQYMKYVGGKDE